MSIDDLSCLLSFMPGEDMLSDNLPDLHSQFSLSCASSGYKLAQLLFASSERKSSLSSSDLLVVSLLLPCEWLRCHSGWKQKLRKQAGSDCFRKQEAVSFSATQHREKLHAFTFWSCFQGIFFCCYVQNKLHVIHLIFTMILIGIHLYYFHVSCLIVDII